MPTSIPFDPALVLGNIVHPKYFDGLDAISLAQSPIDAADENLNNLITLRRSLDMTKQELVQLDIGTDKLQPVADAIETLNGQITTAASDYAKAAAENGPAVVKARSLIKAVHHDVESPVDYNRTQIKRMPLSADSMRMNVQYFSLDESGQRAENHTRNVSSFVSDSMSFLGDSMSEQASSAVAAQTSSQVSNHDIDGTLVIAVTCTHKDAVLLAPFIVDPDKAVRAWNALFPSQAIDTDKPQEVGNSAKSSNAASDDQGGDPNQGPLRIISGATYGSSFIGMVHVLNQNNTEASQSMTSLAASLQGQFEASCWFANESGGFGVDASMADDIKNMLSTQNITSHVSLVTMGSIPSIKSNSVKIGVQQFADFDPAKMMDKLAVLANQTSADNNSVAASAQSARTGGQMVALEGATVKNVMSGLADIDDGQNKMLDINSMMTALDDYVDKALAGQIGVPINYYLKSLSAVDIAKSWVSKYYPGKYLTGSIDDGTASAGDTPAPPPPPPPPSNP